MYASKCVWSCPRSCRGGTPRLSLAAPQPAAPGHAASAGPDGRPHLAATLVGPPPAAAAAPAPLAACFMVGRLRSCLIWLACSACMNSVSVSVLPLLMSAVPNTASSCASSSSCSVRGARGAAVLSATLFLLHCGVSEGGPETPLQHVPSTHASSAVRCICKRASLQAHHKPSTRAPACHRSQLTLPKRR